MPQEGSEKIEKERLRDIVWTEIMDTSYETLLYGQDK